MEKLIFNSQFYGRRNIFSGGIGSARLVVGLNDFRGLYNLNVSMILGFSLQKSELQVFLQ